jgi:hypothetical protein
MTLNNNKIMKTAHQKISFSKRKKSEKMVRNFQKE